MAENEDYEPFSSPERIRRGMKAIRRNITPVEEEIAKTVNPDMLEDEGLGTEPPKTKTILIEGADGRSRLVTFYPANGLVISSVVTKKPVEEGWQPEEPTYGVFWPD